MIEQSVEQVTARGESRRRRVARGEEQIVQLSRGGGVLRIPHWYEQNHPSSCDNGSEHVLHFCATMTLPPQS